MGCVRISVIIIDIVGIVYSLIDFLLVIDFLSFIRTYKPSYLNSISLATIKLCSLSIFLSYSHDIRVIGEKIVFSPLLATFKR